MLDENIERRAALDWSKRLFDTRDSLPFESQIEGLATGSFPSGDGPCQGKRSSAREEKDILLA